MWHVFAKVSLLEISTVGWRSPYCICSCALSENSDDIFMYTGLFSPIVVAMEVMSPVARYLKFIVGENLLSKFQCNVTAVIVVFHVILYMYIVTVW